MQQARSGATDAAQCEDEEEKFGHSSKDLEMRSRSDLPSGDSTGEDFAPKHTSRKRRNDCKVRLWFVTSGVCAKLLVYRPSFFDKVTHLVIDEVHERDVFSQRDSASRHTRYDF